MKNLISFCVAAVMLCTACERNTTPPTIQSTCEAKINGQLKTFNISGASFGRIGDIKIFTLQAITPDSTISFSLTVKDTLHVSALSLKSYVVRYGNVDDTYTPFDESINSDEAFFELLSTMYTQNGSIQVSSFDETQKSISGAFELTATPPSSGTPVQITEGKFTTAFVQ